MAQDVVSIWLCWNLPWGSREHQRQLLGQSSKTWPVLKPVFSEALAGTVGPPAWAAAPGYLPKPADSLLIGSPLEGTELEEDTFSQPHDDGSIPLLSECENVFMN